MDDEDGDRGRKKSGRRRPERTYEPRTPRPIDAAQLQDLALGYAARYATTTLKLRRYLERKLRERVWTPDGAPDIDALVARIAGLGYVDDVAYAVLKARELAGRGFGARRVRASLSAAGIDREAAASVADDDPWVAAVAFARRRRLGPFGRDGGGGDPVRARRELAAMARAGHDFEVARRVLGAGDERGIAALLEDAAGK